MTPTISSHSGIPMPAIMYGTAWKEDKTAHWVEMALEQGFRGIDTACQPKHYNEPGVGEGLKRAYAKGLKRDDLFLQTKFTGIQGQDPNRLPYDPSAPVSEQVEQSVGVSQKNLDTEQVDSLVLHGPLQTWEETLEAWKALEKVQQSGRAKQIGISNFYDPEMLQALWQQATVKPATLQNRFYRDTGYDQEVRQICDQHKIIYQCFWTLTANPHILESTTVQSLAADKAKTPAQIFFRFIHQIGIQILTGTTNPEHMQQDLAIFSFELSTEECSAIASIGRPSHSN